MQGLLETPTQIRSLFPVEEEPTSSGSKLSYINEISQGTRFEEDSQTESEVEESSIDAEY